MDGAQNSTADTRTGPDPDAVALLMREWEPLARRLARRFATAAECDDLEQVARVALWQAARRFDPGRGYQFYTFAVPTIVGALRCYIRDRRLGFGIRRRWWELRPRLRRMADALAQALGREPTVTELAEQLGVSDEDVAGAIAVQHLLHPLSLDEHRDGTDGEETQGLAARIGAIDPLFEAVELRVVVRQAIDRLAPDLRRVLELRYFQNLTAQEAGRRLSVSPMHVSRLERQALASLREDLREALSLRSEAEAALSLGGEPGRAFALVER